jgi:branched-chain amino acid transport system ATP-binding protein
VTVLLETSGLSAGYGRGEVLRHVDLVVEDRETVVLLGANGAGKTTLLRALSGCIPTRGRVVFDGRSIAGQAPERIARAGVGHVPQGRGTFADLSVLDNLRVGGFSRRSSESRADIDRWLEFFPRLADRRSQHAGTMSGGEQQMLAIARALMARPRLLLLDEPSLGLAPKISTELFAALGRISVESGMAMLVVEQSAHLALGIASRAYSLTVGNLSAPQSVETLGDRESLRRLYLGA